jgi:hypothetical protein
MKAGSQTGRYCYKGRWWWMSEVAGGCEQDLWLAVLLQIMLKKMQAVPTAVFSR